MNKKGFTMVELLATVAILGILSGIAITAVSAILNKAHEEYYNSQEKNLVLAAQAYYNANKTKLPKVIGRKSEITASKLKEQNYLKDELTNYDGKPCYNKINPDSKDSYVTVFKYGQSEYSYTAYLNCGSRKASETKKKGNPHFIVNFPPDPGTDKDYKHVADARVNINIMGNEAKTIKLLSYSYNLSYYNGTRYVEVYNSGNKESRELEVKRIVDLSKYTIKGDATIRVKITATNINGNTSTKVFINNYQDKDDPTCTYKNKENDPNSPFRRKTWINHDDKVTIDCHDGRGSGCEKDSYTKTFTKDGSLEYIKIKDNAGRSFDCPIITFIDKTPPKVTVTAYKCGDSTKANAKTIDATGGVTTLSSSDLDSNYDGWLNKKNYPDGVCFDFKITDAGAIKSTSWSWNRSGQKKNATSYTSQNGSSSPKKESFNYEDHKKLTKKVEYTHSLEADGHRYAVFVAEDGIGNKTTINFDMLIDKVAPTMNVSAGRCVDRVAATCEANTHPTDVTSVKVDNDDSSDTINMKTWEIKGIRIAFNIKDNISSTFRKWQWDTNYTMQSPGDASANGHGGGDKVAGSSGVVTFIGTGQRQGILKGYDEAGNSVKVTINGYVSNKCTVTYSPNGGSFGSHSGNTTVTLNFQDYLDNSKNLMRTVRGNNSYYEGSKPDYVIAYQTEWKLDNEYYDQSKAYHPQKICEGMTDGKDKEPTLIVKWMKNNKRIRLYEWDFKKKKCSYKKNSKKKTDRPYREYSFFAYSCRCDYNSNSELVSKAYYARHSLSSVCTPFLLYKDANSTQKSKCFEDFSRIYYRKSKAGKKACKASNTDDYPVNTYVYQVCTNGEAFKHRGSGDFEFFHGVRFFYGSKSHAGSSYMGARTKDYWLTNSEKIRVENPSKMLKYSSYSHINSLTSAVNLSYDHDKSNRLQTVCKNYCTTIWGTHRNIKQDATVDDADEKISTNTTDEDVYQDEEEEDYEAEAGDDD